MKICHVCLLTGDVCLPKNKVTVFIYSSLCHSELRFNISCCLSFSPYLKRVDLCFGLI